MESILIAFLTGGAAVALIRLVHYILIKKFRYTHAITKVLKQVSSLYDILNSAKARTECQRAVIYCTTNGGGIPRVGSVLKATMLYEVYDGATEPMKSAWKERQIDEEYVKILSKMEQEPDGLVIIDPSKIGKGLLKQVLQVHDVKASVMCRINATNDKYYFLSLYFKDKNAVTLDAILDIKDAVAKLQPLIT